MNIVKTTKAAILRSVGWRNTLKVVVRMSMVSGLPSTIFLIRERTIEDKKTNTIKM
jgi:hypothetical protein